MYISYLLGNFIGRAVISFLLVWLICLLASRLNWRLAFARSRRWYSMVAVLVMTMLGMSSAMIGVGGWR